MTPHEIATYGGGVVALAVVQPGMTFRLDAGHPRKTPEGFAALALVHHAPAFPAAIMASAIAPPERAALGMDASACCSAARVDLT